MKLFILILVAFVLIHFLYLWLAPIDSTDKSRWKRSALEVYTDNFTGIQYIKSGIFGGITVRLNREGLPLIEKRKR